MTSAHIIVQQFAESVTYDDEPMTCQNPGPWHLGMSEGGTPRLFPTTTTTLNENLTIHLPPACSNAGGSWFRSPCYTLQNCINNRPANGTRGYSPSFEKFAERITITDPSNATQCNNARQHLGYTSDYPYDVEV